MHGSFSTPQELAERSAPHRRSGVGEVLVDVNSMDVNVYDKGKMRTNNE
jgi:hypothetical protein